MKYSIKDLYLILIQRISEEEILKIVEVRKDILESKINSCDVSCDQFSLSIYFKMYSRISIDEIYRLDQLSGYLDRKECTSTRKSEAVATFVRTTIDNKIY